MKKFILLLILLSHTYLSGSKEVSQGIEDMHVITNAFYGQDIDKINYKDAKVAMDIWIKKMASKLGASSTLLFFKDFDAVKKAKEEGSIDTLILSANSYLQHLEYCKAEFSQGWMKLEKDGKPFFRFVILRRKDLPSKKSYTMEYYRYSKISRTVAEVYGWERGIAFSFKAVAKPSKPVLDIFFKKADYGIVKEQSWLLMQELNPQLKEDIELVYTSDRIFVHIITLFSKHLSKKDKETYIKAIEAINETPEGKQLMELFKFNGLTKMGDSQFQEMENFYKRYQSLKQLHEKQNGE